MPESIQIQARLTGDSAEHYQTLLALLKHKTPYGIEVTPSNVIRYALAVAAKSPPFPGVPYYDREIED
jgi:hypothetical protein